MKIKLLGLALVLVFSATADVLDDIMTNCTNDCNAGISYGDGLGNCSIACYMRRIREASEGYSTELDANPDSMKGAWCPGEVVGDLGSMCY